MIRLIACSLVLGLAGAVALAEERDQQSSSQQQSQQQTDQQQAQQPKPSDREDAAAFRASGEAAAKGEGQAQPAAGREEAMQDPAQMFAKEAYNSNLFEIQAAQLASQKVQDDQIKQFARTMIEDHTKANQQLKQAAQSGQIQLSEQLDQVHQAKLQKMQKCPASELGRKYINSQVAGHWMNVLEFRYQAKNNANAQLKQFASQTLPTLEKHLQHAQQLAEQQAGGGEPRTASERLRGGATDDAGRSQQQGQEQGRGATDQPDAAQPDAAQPGAGQRKADE